MDEALQYVIVLITSFIFGAFVAIVSHSVVLAFVAQAIYILIGKKLVDNAVEHNNERIIFEHKCKETK